ncbi:hypothetical protein AB0M72_31390 [Nocardiopsis dassonvillei]
MNAERPLRMVSARAIASASVVFFAWPWAVFVVGVVLIAASVYSASGLSFSAWETATQVPRWLTLVLAGYLAAVYLPLLVSHGRTRAEVLREGGLVLLALAFVQSVLVALGFLAERAVYGLMGVDQELERKHLFENPSQFLYVVTEFTLILSLWSLVGAGIALAFYRSLLLGFASVPIGFLLTSTSEILVGSHYFGPFPPPDIALEFSLVFSVLSCAALILLAAGALWVFSRRMPIRA